MDNERNWKRTLLAVVDTVTQPLIAVLISFLLGAVVILVIGKNPLLAYGEMIRGAFGKQVYLMNTLKRATPIIMGGLAVCMAWRSGYEAMGGEGQMILGAVAAALVGYYLPVPGWLRIPAAMLAAAAAGALYSAFSGWLFEKFDVTFVISTLMMNYIANYFAAYLCNYPLRDPEANVYQMQNAQTGKLPGGGHAAPDHEGLGALGLRAGGGGGARHLVPVQEDQLRLQEPHGRPEPPVRAVRRHQRPADALPGDDPLRRHGRAGRRV